MRNAILIIGGVAVAGYVLGTRANRPTTKQPRESARHQIERLWTDPKARKRRDQRAKQLKKDARAVAERTKRTAVRRVASFKH